MGISTLSTLIITICTLVYTIFSVLLWLTTNKTLKFLSEEIRIQRLTTQSNNQSELINAHREIYMGILTNDDLTNLFSQELGTDAITIRRKFVATLLINHSLRIFLDFRSQAFSLEDEYIENYINDLLDLFKIPLIRERWIEVKKYHPKAFQNFINKEIYYKNLKR